MIYVLNRKKIHDSGRVAIRTTKRMMIVSGPLRTISSACWCFRFRSMHNSMLCFTRIPSYRLYKALLVKILYLSCKTPCLNIPMVELSCCRLLLKRFSYSISAYWIVAMHTFFCGNATCFTACHNNLSLRCDISFSTNLLHLLRYACHTKPSNFKLVFDLI